MKAYILKRFPFLYQMRIRQLRLRRHLSNLSQSARFSRTRSAEKLPFICKKHQSLLRRRLGSTDPILQENKITNLRISLGRLDGIVIQPGETFSFWKAVGKTTSRKGYIEGLLLSQGGVTAGVGGGICQLANLLFWLALHSPLEIKERHHHSFDPFPDEGRVLPFGSGASVFYNYVDLRFYNPTGHAFQFHLWLTDRHLKGTLASDREWPLAYHMEERSHRFLQRDGKNFRENEIWRKTVDKQTGNTLSEDMLIHNFAEVKYDFFDLHNGQKDGLSS
jgi:vancomycin resistance protein VanW